MPNAKKIAISIPIELYRQIEKIRKKTGETRSAVIRRTIEQALTQEETDLRVRSYIEGYLRYPETVDEKDFVRATMTKALTGEQWE